MTASDLFELLASALERGSVKVTIEISLNMPEAGQMYPAACNRCGWEKDGYASQKAARQGLAMHLARYCPSIHPTSPLKAESLNGHGYENV